MESDDANPETGVKILSPDAEEARAVARAIASSTAGGILRSFQGEERSASEIATALNQPIPTIMYHIDALLEAGLIEVSRITYSVKGREVKKYRQSGQIFVVAPSHADIRETLLKYASLFGFTLFSAVIAYVLMQWPGREQISRVALADLKNDGLVTGFAKSQVVTGYGGEAVSREIVQNNTVYPAAVPAPPPTGTVHASLSVMKDESVAVPDLSVSHLPGMPDLISGILIGGILVIIALICIEYLIRYRKKKV
jgi:DNA-binding transcriptional ArsR family regulator